MAHPILQGLDVADMILQLRRRERVPEFMQEEIRTVRSFRAFVAVLRNALPAIQFRVERDALQFEFVPFVWPVRPPKNQRIRIELLLTLCIS